MTNQIVSRLMILCLILIIIDLAVSYLGVNYLGMIESSFVILSAELIPGIMVVLALFSFFTYVLWVWKKYPFASNASIAGLLLMCVVKLFTVVHNIFVMFT